MCLAAPGKIIKIEGKKALVKYPHAEQGAFVGDNVIKVGDYVLVQMGIIIKILSKSESKIATAAWNKA